MQKKDYFRNLLAVPEAGLEPARCRHRGILSPLRLPIPSLGHQQCLFIIPISFIYVNIFSKKNHRICISKSCYMSWLFIFFCLFDNFICNFLWCCLITIKYRHICSTTLCHCTKFSSIR